MRGLYKQTIIGRQDYGITNNGNKEVKGQFHKLDKYDRDNNRQNFSVDDFNKLTADEKKSFVKDFVNLGGKLEKLCVEGANKEYYTNLANALMSAYTDTFDGGITKLLNNTANQDTFSHIFSNANPDKLKSAVEHNYLNHSVVTSKRDNIVKMLKMLDQQPIAKELLANIEKFKSYKPQVQSVIEKYGKEASDGSFTLNKNKISKLTEGQKLEIIKASVDNLVFMKEIADGGAFDGLSKTSREDAVDAIVKKYVNLLQPDENKAKVFMKDVVGIISNKREMLLALNEYLDKNKTTTFYARNEDGSTTPHRGIIGGIWDIEVNTGTKNIAIGDILQDASNIATNNNLVDGKSEINGKSTAYSSIIRPGAEELLNSITNTDEFQKCTSPHKGYTATSIANFAKEKRLSDAEAIEFTKACFQAINDDEDIEALEAAFRKLSPKYISKSAIEVLFSEKFGYFGSFKNGGCIYGDDLCQALGAILQYEGGQFGKEITGGAAPGSDRGSVNYVLDKGRNIAGSGDSYVRYITANISSAAISNGTNGVLITSTDGLKIEIIGMKYEDGMTGTQVLDALQKLNKPIAYKITGQESYKSEAPQGGMTAEKDESGKSIADPDLRKQQGANGKTAVDNDKQSPKAGPLNEAKNKVTQAGGTVTKGKGNVDNFTFIGKDGTKYFVYQSSGNTYVAPEKANKRGWIDTGKKEDINGVGFTWTKYLDKKIDNQEKTDTNAVDTNGRPTEIKKEDIGANNDKKAEEKKGFEANNGASGAGKTQNEQAGKIKGELNVKEDNKKTWLQNELPKYGQGKAKCTIDIKTIAEDKKLSDFQKSQILMLKITENKGDKDKNTKLFNAFKDKSNVQSQLVNSFGREIGNIIDFKKAEIKEGSILMRSYKGYREAASKTSTSTT